MTTIAAKDIRCFFNRYSQSITHLAVAHTHFRPANCTQAEIDKMVQSASKRVRHFRNCFNQFLYQAKSKRKPLLYQPLMLTTVEGADGKLTREKTIHFNFSLGNIPTCITTSELRAIFAFCWVEKANLSAQSLWLDDAPVLEVARWNNYITKEAERGNVSTWDFCNTQIPFEALASAQRT